MEEFLEMADAIRPYMEQAMKIEVAPWIKDYVVNMEELYTELVLEKVDNKPFGISLTVLGDYKELFKKIVVNDSLQEPNAAKRLRLHNSNIASKEKKPIAQKIIIKGDPGMGKTTLCKKIAWDWARKLFEKFDIVFFVFLKLVKRHDTIENIIIQQNHFIEGLKITQGKIKSILETFGNRCLLILDGLDEHALGTNDDVLQIIRGVKYLNCNIIVTSRPHSTRDIEPHFPVISRVEGFTENKARQFASKILRDKQKIAAVLNFNPADFRKDVPIYKCPILLSFMCLLVNEDNIDLSDKNIQVGDIYTRMVRCLYRKFTIRKGIDFDNRKFLKDVLQIGKMALKTLLSGNPMLKRTDVIREVGPDAFDYGLLIGHEDFRLIRDETADICVTFPHRSIQEFLAAFYFVFELHEGSPIETVLGKGDEKPIFLRNPLFLQFSLWFLCSSKKYFNFHRGDDIYKYLKDFCVNKVNGVDLDLPHIRETYPVLDVKGAYDRNDQLRLQFLKDILLSSDRTSCVIGDLYDPLDWIMSSLGPVLKRVTHLQRERRRLQESQCYVTNNIGEFRISHLQSKDVIINMSEIDVKYLNVINYKKLGVNPSIYLYLDRPTKMFSSSHVYLKALYIKYGSDPVDILGSNPHLTHLSFQAQVEKNVLQKGMRLLCEAVSNRRLPCLSHLSIVGFGEAKSNLTLFFQCSLSQLQHLSLLYTELSETDLEDLYFACNGPEKTLPNLSSLFLSVPPNVTKETFSSKLFGLHWWNLKRFHIDYSMSNSDLHISLSEAIKDGKLKNLNSLGIQANLENKLLIVDPRCIEKLCNLKSLYLREGTLYDVPKLTLLRLYELGIYSCEGLTGRLSTLICHHLQLLKTMTLRDCGLNSQDLSSLAKAYSDGALFVLKHLDISDNVMTLPEFMCLFDASCTWNQLLSLDIKRMTKLSDGFDEDRKWTDCMNTIVKQGKLSSLQHLGINWYHTEDTVWPKLENLCLLYCNEDLLSNITTAVRSRFLPALHTVCVVHYDGYDARVTSTLTEMGLSCHEFCSPWDDPFYPGKCHCYES